jgi:hypothetical protein
MDINSLYMKIPNREGIDASTKHLNSHSTTGVNIQMIWSMLEWILNNNNNIYSGNSTHWSVFHGGPVIYIYIIHGKLYYAYLKTIKYLQMDYI